MTEYYLEATDVDERCWMRLPTEWPMPDFEDVFPDPEPWSRAAAGVRWEDSGLTPGPDDVRALAKTLAYCAQILPERMPGYEIFLYLPSPQGAPRAVYAGDIEVVSREEAEVEFAVALGLDQPNAVETPLVEDFAVPTLGVGKRSLRYGKADDGSVFASLRYVWDIEEHGLVATVRVAAAGPTDIVAMSEDVDRLCQGLRYLPEDAFPE